MAGDLKAQLELSADSRGVVDGVEKAKKSLASMGDAAVAAGQKASAGIDKLSASADAADKQVARATKSAAAGIQKNIADLLAGGRLTTQKSAEFSELMARQKGASVDVLRPLLDVLDEASRRQKTVIRQNREILSAPAFTTSLGATDFVKQRQQSVVLQRTGIPAGLSTSLGASPFGEVAAGATKADAAVKGLNKSFDYSTLTAKQTTAALRQVPAQLTDIVVSLQGGQAPLTVLLQQGGQLKDVFGGIGPAARALGGYVLSLVNPFTLASAAVAALALAYKQGTDEIDAYAKALILSGNATGATVSQLNKQAKAISEITGTQGQAAEALAEFAANGNIAANSLERFTTVAVQLNRTAGQAVSKTVEQFAALGKEPLQASIKLNETTRFLTVSLYQQIKALEDQGRVAEAAAVAQNGFASAMESRTTALQSRLGSIERSWIAVKDAAAGAWSAMLNIGRGDSGTKLDEAREDLAELEKINQAARARGGTPTPQFQARLEQQRQIVYALDETIRLENRSAEAQAASVRQTKSRIDFDAIAKKNLVDKGELLKKEIELIKNAGKAAGASQKEIDDAIAGARERFKPAKGPKDKQGSLDRSELSFDLSAIKAESDRLLGVYSDAERVLETLRAGSLVKDRQYYESRRQFLALETSAKEDAFNKEIARLREEDKQINDLKVPSVEKQKLRVDNDRKIAEATSKLAILQAQASSKNTVLNLEEANSLRRLEESYTQARQAAQNYLDTQNLQQNRLINNLGKGDRQLGLDLGVNQIEDDGNARRRELDNLRILGKLEEGEYDRRLSIINEFQQKSIASFVDYYNRLIAEQSKASVGAQKAINNYVDSASNIARSTEDLFTSTFQNAEDALTKFLTTGKLNYKEFADSLVVDITRIIVKQQLAIQVQKLLGVVGDSGSGFGSFLQGLVGGTIGGRAAGGSVSKGSIYEVNENGGPGELLNVGGRQYLMASQSGSVTPQTAQSSPNNQALTVINNFMLSSRPDSSTQAQLAKTAGMGVQRALARNG